MPSEGASGRRDAHASIRVRMFASLREIAGSAWLETTAPDVSSLIDQLEARFGAEFGRIANAGTVVVNGETASRDRALAPNDEVALLPPVSGGDAPILTRRQPG